MLNKKAQIGDMLFVIVTLISIAITLLVAGYVYVQIDSGFEDSGLESNESAEAYDSFAVSFGIFDTGMGFILVGLIIGLLISSYFIPTSPVFVVINIIGFLILVFIGAVFSNLYSEMILQPGLNTSALLFPITNFIATKLPFIGAIIVFLSSIIMFAKGTAQ